MKRMHPNRSRSALLALLLLMAAGTATAAQPASDDLWRGISATPQRKEATSQAIFRLDRGTLQALTARAPKQGLTPLSQSQTIISLPMPDGSLSRFRIEESPVFEPALAAQYPEIRSYRGQGIDIPGATLRFDWTPLGFHALMLASDMAVTVHPQTRDAAGDYVSAETRDARRDFECGVVESGALRAGDLGDVSLATGGQLRTYRIAISTTGEFTQDVGGGTVAGALAALNTILNGINAIYERDLAVHLNLIAGLEPVIFTNPATDPYTNGNTGAMLSQVQATLGANVPIGNYDLGHVVGTNSGGVAWVGAVCNNNPANAPLKAGGVSAASLPLGSTNNINLMSHEIGHQFGAPHTQNSNCNRSPLDAVEPGSGVTVMSYNGVCPPNNTVPIGELRFHAWSLALMNAYIATQACQVSTPTGNNVPTVNAGPDRTIPVNTPFTLTATGGDADAGDLPNLTYAWEQVDPGQLNAGATDFPNPPFEDQIGDPATTTRPILTALATSSSPARTFPRPTYILNNANDPPDQVNGLFTAEELPRVPRNLNFRVTVRDNRAGAGGTNDDLVTLTVAAAGPFRLTVPNGGQTWTVGSQQNVTWSVNGTNNAPVSCANVRISLSTDGGITFPLVLAASTANDGSELVTVPNGVNTPSARVKVEAVGNIFFDVSDGNFTINAGPGCPFVTNILPGAGNAGAVVTLNGTGFTGVTGVRFSNSVAATFTVVNDATITATVPAGAVTGPVTLTKAACPDVPTSDFTVCPNPSLLAQVDDGSGENFWSGTHFVSRLTPNAYPATLSQVVMQLNSTFGVPAGSAITVLYGANPGGTADISGVVLQTVPGTSNADGNFKSFDVPLLTITSGDFVVGYSVPSGSFPGFSDIGTPAGRSYISGDGTFGSSTVNSNHLIRARYFTGCGTAPSCPAVAGLNPASGAVGSSVTITGTNFTGVTGVTFSNSVAATFTVVNPSQITATVPAGAVSGPITISKPGCTPAQTASFTVGAASCPTVAGLAPTTGPVGSSVVITGANFTGVSGVTFSNNVTAAFTVDNATQITATVPAGAVSGPITISKAACTPVQTASFTVGAGGGVTVCATPGTAIPDNDPAGVTSDLVVASNLTITNLTVSVNIPHTFIGDLLVELRRGATTVRLHDRSGLGADNLVGTYPTTLTVAGPGSLADFNGQASAGTWTLFVSDNEAQDVGTITEWCLNIEGTPIATCPAVTNLAPTTGPAGSNVVITGTDLTGVDGVKFSNNVTALFTVDSPTQITATVPAGATSGPITVSKTGCAPVQTAVFTPSVRVCATPGTAIPDLDPAGISSNLVVTDNLTITDLKVSVNIPHTFIGDLVVELRRGTDTVRLHNLGGGGTDNIVGTYPTTLAVAGPGSLADFVGKSSAGTWTLFVSDNAAEDVGTLVEWCLEIQGTPGVTSADPPVAGPLAFRIAPNPLVSETTINFSLPQSGVTSVRIVDLAGRLVRQLHSGWSVAGPQQIRWDGRDRGGAPVKSGIYFVAVDGAGGLKARGKLTISR